MVNHCLYAFLSAFFQKVVLKMYSLSEGGRVAPAQTDILHVKARSSRAVSTFGSSRENMTALNSVAAHCHVGALPHAVRSYVGWGGETSSCTGQRQRCVTALL